MKKSPYLILGNFILAFALAGCSSVKRDAVFTASDDRAFVLLTADSKPGSTISSGTTIYMFRQVDPESSAFLNEWIRIVFAKFEFDSDELQEPAGLQTTHRFAGVEAPEGDYALISRHDLNGQSRKQTCYSLGTTVFRVRKGRVNVLSVNQKLSERISGGRTVLPIAREFIGGYPGITAPLEWSHPVSNIIFATENRRFFENACQLSGGFTVVRRAAVKKTGNH